MSYLNYSRISGTNEYMIGSLNFIGHNTGMLNKTIVDVIIPARYYECLITVIGYDAFSHSNIERIFIPKTIKRIIHGAFYQCQKLFDVSFEKGSALEEIGIEAFAFCSALRYLDIPSSLKTFEKSNCVIFNTSPNIACISYFGSTDFSDAALFSDGHQLEIRVSDSYKGTFGGREITRSTNECYNKHWNPFVRYIRPKPIKCTNVPSRHHAFSTVIYLFFICS